MDNIVYEPWVTILHVGKYEMILGRGQWPLLNQNGAPMGAAYDEDMAKTLCDCWNNRNWKE
jgi:hypothetical protein